MTTETDPKYREAQRELCWTPSHALMRHVSHFSTSMKADKWELTGKTSANWVTRSVCKRQTLVFIQLALILFPQVFNKPKNALFSQFREKPPPLKPIQNRASLNQGHVSSNLRNFLCRTFYNVLLRKS